MGITINDIGGLLARFGNEIVNNQVNMACPFVGNGHIQKIKHSHEQGVVRVRQQDGLTSTGQIEDGSYLPQGSNVSFTAGTYLPKIFFTRLSIPRGAAHLADGGRDGVRLVREELEVAGRQLGKVLGQAVFEAPVAQLWNTDGGAPGALAPDTLPAAVSGAGGTTTLQASANPADIFNHTILLVDSIAGLYEGQSVALADIAAGPNVFVSGRVTHIEYEPNVYDEYSPSATAPNAKAPIVFTNAPAPGVFTIRVNIEADQFGVPGYGGGYTNALGWSGTESVSGGLPMFGVAQQTGNTEPFGPFGPQYVLTQPDPMVSLGAAAGNQGLYNMPTPPTSYTGNTSTLNAPLTAQAMRTMSTLIKRRAGYGWHSLVMNSNNLQRYFENTIATTAALNFLPGETTKDADGGSAVPMFQGLPIIVDENCPDDRMFFFNKDDIKLAEFKGFGPDADGGQDYGMVDRTKLIYDTQIWGMYNMRVQRRNSMGMITGITG